MALGKTLKALRQKQGLNQKSLSALSGVSQATISRIETGRVRQLRSAALKNLADAMGVSTDFLMGDHEVFAPIPTAEATSVAGMREDRFRQIADTLDAFALHDKGRFLYVNQTLADLLGYQRSELLGSNVIELVTVPQSQTMAQRMLQSDRADSCEILLRRKDNTMFPAEISTGNVTDSVSIGVVRDVTCRRSQQAAERVLQIGLKAENLEDLGQVVRLLADEIEDMGFEFETFSLNIVDEDQNRLTTYSAYPKTKDARSFVDEIDLRDPLAQPLTNLLRSHWQRGKVWQRELDDKTRALIGQFHSFDADFGADFLVDVPFLQGTLTLGLDKTKPLRNDDLIALLSELAPALSSILKRLQQVETLLNQLKAAHQALQAPASETPEANEQNLELFADPDAIHLCQNYRNLPAPGRDLVRSFIRKLGEEHKEE